MTVGAEHLARKVGSRMSRVGSYARRTRRVVTWPASKAGRILFCLIVSPLRLLVLVVLLINAAAHASAGSNGLRAEGPVIGAPSAAASNGPREFHTRLNPPET